MKVVMTCLVCGGEITLRGKAEDLDELVKLWDSQHEACRQLAAEADTAAQ